MCGRYLLEDEAYADILQILHELNKAKKSATGGIAPDELSGGIVQSEPGESGCVNLVHDKLMNDNFIRGEIFPTSIAPICTNDGLVSKKWGFPHWKNSGVIINARAETASERRMFRKPLKEHRCVVPSSGFYEWNRGKSKQKDKYFFRRPGENTLYMAGIVGIFRDAAGTEYAAFAILTTAANDSVSPIHDRMPVILAPDELSLWITDDGFTEYALHRHGPELVSMLSNDTAEDYFESIFD